MEQTITVHREGDNVVVKIPTPAEDDSECALHLTMDRAQAGGLVQLLLQALNYDHAGNLPQMPDNRDPYKVTLERAIKEAQSVQKFDPLMPPGSV